MTDTIIDREALRAACEAASALSALLTSPDAPEWDDDTEGGVTDTLSDAALLADRVLAHLDRVLA